MLRGVRGNNSPIILSQSGVPVGIPSSGSIGNNGALTLTTAFPTTYSGGIYLYFPANAIFAGSAAGLYWTLMSSTTVGTIYNNTYSSGDVTIPASPTPFVTTGPGAYTQSLNEITLRQNTIPGGMLGLSGSIRTTLVASMNSSANSRSIRVRYGSQQGFLSSVSSVGGVQPLSIIRNRGVANSQIGFQGTNGIGTSTATPPTLAVNSAVDAPLDRTIQLTVATDYLVMEADSVEILPS